MDYFNPAQPWIDKYYPPVAQPAPQVPVAAPSPAVAPVVTGIDPNELANATYDRPIPISALGKARIGTAGIIFGPYIDSGAATFAVSFGMAADPAGSRAIYEIAFDSKVAWQDPAGFAGSGTPATGFTSEPFTFRFKQGTLTQGVDALETAEFGAEAIAYRPQMVLFIENLPLAQFGNKLPYVAALIGDITGGADPDDGINLGDAFERVAASPWVDMAEFETDGITDVVGGMILAQDISFLQLLQNFTQAYRNLDIVQTDALKVIDRGPPGAPDITLDRDSILGSDPVTFQIQESASVPRELELITIDPDADYTFVPSKAQRPRDPVAVSASVGKQSINLPVILEATTRQALVAYAKYAEEQARKRVTLTSMVFGLAIEPGDRIEIANLGAGYDDELFRVIDTTHGADHTVQIVAESILNCFLPVDPYISNVVLLLGFNGFDGSTSIIDESPQEHGAATVANNAHISTSGALVGTGSLLLDGTLDEIFYADDADWELSAANSDQFTIEMLVKFVAVGALNRGLIAHGNTIGSWAFKLELKSGDTSNLTFSASNAGTAFDIVIHTAAAGITTGIQYHIAVDKDAAGKIRLYVDGVMLGSDTPADSSFHDSAQLLYIGGSMGGTIPMSGRMDEVRITKGTARYASDSGFSVPIGAFPRE